jgi:hypothetical protein
MTADRKRRVPRGVTAGIVAVVLISGAVVAWRQVRSSGSDPCRVSSEVTETDEIGGATAQLARERWTSVVDLGLASDQPVFSGQRDDLGMADYQLDEEHRVDAQKVGRCSSRS